MLSQKEFLETLLQHQSVQTQLLIEWVSQYVGQKIESQTPPVGMDGNSLNVYPEKFGAVRFDAGDSGPALSALAAAFDGKYSKRFELNNRYALGQKIAFGNSVFILGNGQQLEEAGFSPFGAYAGVMLEGRDSLTVLATAFASGNRADNRFTHVAIHQPANRKWLRVDVASFFGFDVGIKLQSHYHSIRAALFSSNNVGVLAQGATSGNEYDCGSLTIDGRCHFANNAYAGVQLDGNVNDVVIRDCTFENNLHHVINGGGDLLIENCYLGDDPKFALLQTKGNTTLRNPMRQPVHGGGFLKKPAGESPRVNWITGAVRVTGGRVNLDGGSYDNCVYAGAGYSNYNGVNGQNKGAVIIAENDAQVSLKNIRSNVWCPFEMKGTSKLVDCEKIPNYIHNGTMLDRDRLPFDFGGAYVFDNAVRTPFGSNVLEIDSTTAVRFRVPKHYVGKTMYLALLLYKHNNGFPCLLWPGAGADAIKSKGWESVPFNVTPAQGNVNYSAGSEAYVLPSPDYDNEYPYMNWMPVKILEEVGTFALFATAGGKFRIGGIWLTELENLGAVAEFAEPNTNRWSTAAPALGTWKTNDAIDILPNTAGGFSRRVCTAAGAPGTWKGAGAIEA